MSLTKTAEATRAVLKIHKDRALDGTLTIEEVINLVRQSVPTAHRLGILQAIESYGPVGEDDEAWERRAEKPQIPGWFYNPRTGGTLE